jgi:molybdopterin-binding protein
MRGKTDLLRIGQAAELLGVTVDTLRRWGDAGRIDLERSAGGQRRVRVGEVSRLLADRRDGGASSATRIVAESARNRFSGIISRIDRGDVAAVVEVMAGPHRFVSLMTREAVDELRLRVGDPAVCSVKATNVVIEVPG